ncbi:hypothetical protein BR93DRAFT_134403 [Coniochaeta sp. PMI_546]|nr:hypothetical protein BR93DRAFT_134403 [Coniochaeta sp. PMI_546]
MLCYTAAEKTECILLPSVVLRHLGPNDMTSEASGNSSILESQHLTEQANGTATVVCGSRRTLDGDLRLLLLRVHFMIVKLCRLGNVRNEIVHRHAELLQRSQWTYVQDNRSGCFIIHSLWHHLGTTRWCKQR